MGERLLGTPADRQKPSSSSPQKPVWRSHTPLTKTEREENGANCLKRHSFLLQQCFVLNPSKRIPGSSFLAPPNEGLNVPDKQPTSLPSPHIGRKRRTLIPPPPSSTRSPIPRFLPSIGPFCLLYSGGPRIGSLGSIPLPIPFLLSFSSFSSSCVDSRL